MSELALQDCLSELLDGGDVRLSELYNTVLRSSVEMIYINDIYYFHAKAQSGKAV
jgi:hypothetical protein